MFTSSPITVYSFLSSPVLFETVQAPKYGAVDLTELIETFSVQWDKEMRPFGFEIQTARFGTLLLRLKYVKKKIKDYLKGKIGSIGELEEKQQPFGYNLSATEDNYFLMCWINIFTTGLCL